MDFPLIWVCFRYWAVRNLRSHDFFPGLHIFCIWCISVGLVWGHVPFLTCICRRHLYVTPPRFRRVMLCPMFCVCIAYGNVDLTSASQSRIRICDFIPSFRNSSSRSSPQVYPAFRRQSLVAWGGLISMCICLPGISHFFCS